MGDPQAALIIVGGHEGGGDVAVERPAECGPVFRSTTPRRLRKTLRQALESTDLPVCVVPMTLGRDPRLVADTARTLTALAGTPAAARVVLADPFGTPTLLTGWLRVAAAQAADPLDATDLAVVVTANAANRFDDAELFRVAHLAKVQVELPWMEVAFRDGDPGLDEVIDRCGQLGARRIAVIAADFRPAIDPDTPTPGVIDGGPLLAPAAVSGMLATRIAGALLKLSHGDDGIAAGLDANHAHGHGGDPWQDPDADPGHAVDAGHTPDVGQAPEAKAS